MNNSSTYGAAPAPSKSKLKMAPAVKKLIVRDSKVVKILGRGKKGLFKTKWNDGRVSYVCQATLEKLAPHHLNAYLESRVGPEMEKAKRQQERKIYKVAKDEQEFGESFSI